MLPCTLFLVVLLSVKAVVVESLAEEDKAYEGKFKKDDLLKFEPRFNQNFEANKCTSLDDAEAILGPGSYKIWAEAQKENKNVQGCTCEETAQIAKAVRHSKKLNLETDMAWVWRAFCEGKEDPITDDKKFKSLLEELKKYPSEHLLELLKYGEELVRGWLNKLPFDHKDWNIAFVMNEIVTRKEDEALVTGMEFCYEMNLDKSVYTKMASDKDNNKSEQGFYRYFMDYAREDKQLGAYLRTDMHLVAEVIDNSAALFKTESRTDEAKFKSECVKFGKEFFGFVIKNRWSLPLTNAALKKYVAANNDDDKSIEAIKTEKRESFVDAAEDAPFKGKFTKEALAAYEPGYNQKFIGSKCKSLDTEEGLLGVGSYQLWADKQKENKKIQGCTCEEAGKISKVVRNSLKLNLEKDMAWVWRAFCEGNEDPITDDKKLDDLLESLEIYGSKHILDFLRYGEEIARGYLKNLSLKDKDWNVTFVMNQVADRAEDEALVTAMEFCYQVDLHKSVYLKMASDRGNNKKEQGFYYYFMDYAREVKELTAYLKTDPLLIPEVIDNSAALFKNESRDDEAKFKGECDKFGKEFFGFVMKNKWSLPLTNAALKKYVAANNDDDKSIEAIKTEKRESFIEDTDDKSLKESFTKADLSAWKPPKSFKQAFEADKCTSLDDAEGLLGIGSYKLWAEKQTENKKAYGCTCEEAGKIAKAVRNSKKVNLTTDFAWVWRAFCEGAEDPITDKKKLESLLSELEIYSSEHIVEFLKYAEGIARGYLKTLPLDDKKWGVAFVMGEVAAREEDEALATAMEFCYELNFPKSVYVKMAEDRNNSKTEQGFYHYFMDYAKEDKQLISFLKTDPNVIPDIIDNSAALFRTESREDEARFKNECDKFSSAFFGTVQNNVWSMDLTNLVLKNYVSKRYDDDKAIEEVKNEKAETLNALLDDTEDKAYAGKFTKADLTAWTPPAYIKQAFEADKCTSLDDEQVLLGVGSYKMWVEKEAENKKAYGCTCEEARKISKVVRNSLKLNLEKDMWWVWRAFCEGTEDPITDDKKLDDLLAELKAYGSDDILELLKWGEEIVRGYLKALPLTDDKWGLKFVMYEIATREEDEALVTVMEFCYTQQLDKAVYTKVAEDTDNNKNEQGFIRYFLDYARQDKELVDYLKTDQTKIAEIINNSAALFKKESRDDEAHFKSECEKFAKQFFETPRKNSWSIVATSAALKKYCSAKYDDDKSIELIKTEKQEDVKSLETETVWC